MWTTIFALTFATAIIFSVASYMVLHTKYLARFQPIKGRLSGRPRQSHLRIHQKRKMSAAGTRISQQPIARRGLPQGLAGRTAVG
jgi:hypothetical protein